MAKGNFDQAIKYVLQHEGGYVDDPKDRGGATNMGVTFKVLQAYRGEPITKADVKALKRPEAEEIYRKQYWNAVRGDQLPDGLDYAMFDFAVNSGAGRAIKNLQGVLRVKQDGALGGVTLDVIRKKNDIDGLIDDLSNARLSFLKKTYGWGRFGKGWSRRVAEVRILSKRLIDPTYSTYAGKLTETPTNEAAQKVAISKTGQGKAALASTIGSVGIAATDAAAKLEGFASMSKILNYAFIALTVIGIAATLYVTLIKPDEAMA